MAIGGAWGSREELLHPRDRRGRFRKKWKMAEGVANKILSFLDAFSPRMFQNDAQAAQYAFNDGSKKPFNRGELSRLTMDIDEANEHLRTGDMDAPTKAFVQMMDAHKQPSRDDLILSRTVPSSAFGLTPEQMGAEDGGIEDFTGKLIADRAYGASALGGIVTSGDKNGGGPAGPGRVTMRIAVPKGTPLVMPATNRDDRTVIMDRDQEYRVTKLQPDGAGGWYMAVVATPRTKGDTPTPLNQSPGGVGLTPEQREARISQVADVPAPSLRREDEAAQQRIAMAEAAVPIDEARRKQRLEDLRLRQVEQPQEAPQQTEQLPEGVEPRNEPVITPGQGGAPAAPAAAPATPTPADVTAPPARPTPEAFRAAVGEAGIPSPSAGSRRREWNNAYLGITGGKRDPGDALRELETDIAQNKRNLDANRASGAVDEALEGDIATQERLADLISEQFTLPRTQAPEAAAPVKAARKAVSSQGGTKAAGLSPEQRQAVVDRVDRLKREGRFNPDTDEHKRLQSLVDQIGGGAPAPVKKAAAVKAPAAKKAVPVKAPAAVAPVKKAVPEKVAAPAKGMRVGEARRQTALDALDENHIGGIEGGFQFEKIRKGLNDGTMTPAQARAAALKEAKKWRKAATDADADSQSRGVVGGHNQKADAYEQLASALQVSQSVTKTDKYTRGEGAPETKAPTPKETAADADLAKKVADMGARLDAKEAAKKAVPEAVPETTPEAGKPSWGTVKSFGGKPGDIVMFHGHDRKNPKSEGRRVQIELKNGTYSFKDLETGKDISAGGVATRQWLSRVPETPGEAPAPVKAAKKVAAKAAQDRLQARSEGRAPAVEKVTALERPLEKNTISELRKIALDENIELPKRALKADIVKAIQDRRSGATAPTPLAEAVTPEPSAPAAKALKRVPEGSVPGPKAQVPVATPERRSDFKEAWSGAGIETGNDAAGRSLREVRDDVAAGKITPEEGVRRIESDIAFNKEDLTEIDAQLRGQLPPAERRELIARAEQLEKGIAEQEKASGFMRGHFEGEAPVTKKEILRLELPADVAKAVREASPEDLKDEAVRQGLDRPKGDTADEVIQDIARKMAERELADRAAKAAKKAVKKAPAKKAEPPKIPVDRERMDARVLAQGLGIEEWDALGSEGYLDEVQRALDGEAVGELPKNATPAAIGRQLERYANRKKDLAAIRYGGMREGDEYKPEAQRHLDIDRKRADALLELAKRLQATRRPAAKKAVPAKKVAPEVKAAEARADTLETRLLQGALERMQTARTEQQVRDAVAGLTFKELKDLGNQHGVKARSKEGIVQGLIDRHGPEAGKTPSVSSLTRKSGHSWEVYKDRSDFQSWVSDETVYPTSDEVVLRDIEDAWASLATGDSRYVGLARIRDVIGDKYPRTQVDRVLGQASRSPGLTLIPESNEKALTDKDWDAHIVKGNQPKHVLGIAGERAKAAYARQGSSAQSESAPQAPDLVPGGGGTEILDRLRDFDNPPSREEAHELLKPLSKAALREMADEISVPGASSMSMTKLRAEIVEGTAGRRLDSIATRGFKGVRPGGMLEPFVPENDVSTRPLAPAASTPQADVGQALDTARAVTEIDELVNNQASAAALRKRITSMPGITDAQRKDLDGAVGDSQRLQALADQIALEAGLSPISRAGSVESYDPKRHTVVPGLKAGDRVQVVRRGYSLRRGGQETPLSKPTVMPAVPQADARKALARAPVVAGKAAPAKKAAPIWHGVRDQVDGLGDPTPRAVGNLVADLPLVELRAWGDSIGVPKNANTRPSLIQALIDYYSDVPDFNDEE